MANEERPKTNRSWSKTRASHTTCIRSRASSRRYTFEACIFGAVRVRYDVEEVVVHGSSWEVVVHVATVVEVVILVAVVEVDVHSRFGEVLDESNVFGATVVVHVSCRVHGGGNGSLDSFR